MAGIDFCPTNTEDVLRARNEKFINDVTPLIEESWAHAVGREMSKEEFCKMVGEKFEELFDATLNVYYTSREVSVYWDVGREQFFIEVHCKVDSHGMSLTHALHRTRLA